jgi:hypothetical protein
MILMPELDFELKFAFIIPGNPQKLSKKLITLENDKLFYEEKFEDFMKKYGNKILPIGYQKYTKWTYKCNNKLLVFNKTLKEQGVTKKNCEISCHYSFFKLKFIFSKDPSINSIDREITFAQYSMGKFEKVLKELEDEKLLPNDVPKYANYDYEFDKKLLDFNKTLEQQGVTGEDCKIICYPSYVFITEIVKKKFEKFHKDLVELDLLFYDDIEKIFDEVIKENN